jgi:hypothetical protein
MVMVRSVRLAMLGWTCFLTAFASTAGAQLPQVLPVSGVLSDSDGNPIEGETELILALYDRRSGGDPLYSERATVTPSNGRFSHYLGSGESAEQFDLAIFGGGSEFYLGIAIGGDEEATPRILIGSVPYAAYAGDAMTVGGKTPADFQPKLSGSCESNEAIQGFDETGGVQCATIQTPAGGTLTGIGTSPGSGLTGGCSSGTCQLGIDFDDLQRRAIGSCSGGQFMVSIGEDGMVQCVAGYRDSDAVAAMGAKANTNPLNHDRYTNAEAVAAMGTKANTNPLNHDRYTNAEAVAAMGTKGNSNPLNHDRYTNAEAVAAMGAKANSNPLNHDRMVCFQAVNDCTTNPCQAFCNDYDGPYGDTNDFMAVGGGCDLAAGGTLNESSLAMTPAGPFPASPTTSFNGWNCEGNGAADIQGTYVICCR